MVKRHLVNQKQAEKAVFKLYSSLGMPIILTLIAVPVLCTLFFLLYPVYLLYMVNMAQGLSFVCYNILQIDYGQKKQKQRTS